MVAADIEVKGSHLPTSFCTTSGTTLVIIKKGSVMTSSSSGTNGTHALSTGLVVEDTGEGLGYGDERL